MRYPAAVELRATVLHTVEGVGGEPRLQMLETEALDTFRQLGIRPGVAATLGPADRRGALFAAQLFLPGGGRYGIIAGWLSPTKVGRTMPERRTIFDVLKLPLRVSGEQS